MLPELLPLILTAASFALAGSTDQTDQADPCYDDRGAARRCIPDFENAAFDRTVEVCGSAGCTSAGPHLTDLHNAANATCWESDEPAFNLTLRLGKKYELTYVSVQLCSTGSTPPDLQHLAIYKSADGGRTWIPFQYYSAQCRRAFGRAPASLVQRSNEQEALCSELPAAQNRRVAFSTMEGRPSASRFDASPVLQDWVTVTDVRVAVSARHRQQGVGVSDLAVGGRCKCNGHASRCVVEEEGEARCECRHNTAGRDCERCRPFHFDRPWGRATAERVNECVGKFFYFSIFLLFIFFFIVLQRDNLEG